MQIPTSYPHRFEEEDLNDREWTPDSSIVETIEEFVQDQVLAFVNSGGKEVEHLRDDFVVKHHYYCAGTASLVDSGTEVEELEEIFAGARAGDIIEVWTLSQTPRYYEFRLPDENLLFPQKGSY